MDTAYRRKLLNFLASESGVCLPPSPPIPCSRLLVTPGRRWTVLIVLLLGALDRLAGQAARPAH
jgi:hypothetical protein